MNRAYPVLSSFGMPYPGLLLLVVLHFVILCYLQCCTTCRSIRLICMRWDLVVCVRTFQCWPFKFWHNVLRDTTVETWAKAGCTAADMAYPCHTAWLSKGSVPLLAVMERWNKGSTFELLGHVLMDSRYPNLVRCLFSCFFRLVTCISPSIELWATDCDLELSLRRYASRIFARWKNVKFLATPPMHPPSHYV